MTTREALIAAIADKPGDALPRLVAADWFEENGDPERAEFIRLQIATPQAGQGHQFRLRVNELLAAHSKEWFGPMLTAFHPSWPQDVTHICSNARLAEVRPVKRGPRDVRFISNALVNGGFVFQLNLNLVQLNPAVEFGRVLRTEPVWSLKFEESDFRDWSWFSVPELKQVWELRFEEMTRDGIATISHDPHLTGVRFVELGINTPADLGEVVAASPLVRRLDTLWMNLNDAGLRAFTRADGIRLKFLVLMGRSTVTAAGLEGFASSVTASELDNLSINGRRLNDAGLRSLSTGHVFPRLTSLDLYLGNVTERGLAALATAAFTPRLQRLSLWFVDGSPLPVDVLRPLAEALQPDVLRSLEINNFSEEDVPAFLTVKFGSRAHFG